MVSYFVGSNIVSWQQLFKTENHADEPGEKNYENQVAKKVQPPK